MIEMFAAAGVMLFAFSLGLSVGKYLYGQPPAVDRWEIEHERSGTMLAETMKANRLRERLVKRFEMDYPEVYQSDD